MTGGALPGRRYVPAKVKTNVKLLRTKKNSGFAAANAKITTADTRCETYEFVRWREWKGRGIVGVLMRICGRVKTRVEACRAARSGRGNILASSCSENCFIGGTKMWNYERTYRREGG